MWVTCFFTVSSATYSSSAIWWFCLPAASRRSTSNSRSLSASTRPGTTAPPGLAGDAPHVALSPGERDRLGQGGHRAGFLAAGRQRQRLQRLDLDDAASPLLRRRRGAQPLQQPQRLVGPVLGEQHPRQHQVLRLPGVARLVVWAEAALPGPAGGCGGVALGQQQPRPLRRDRVEQAGYAGG